MFEVYQDCYDEGYPTVAKGFATEAEAVAWAEANQFGFAGSLWVIRSKG